MTYRRPWQQPCRYAWPKYNLRTAALIVCLFVGAFLCDLGAVILGMED